MGTSLNESVRSPEERLEFLRRLPLWTALSQDGLQAIADAMQPASFSSGDLIIQQGAEGSHLYVLVSGQAEVRVHTAGDSTVAVATLCPGDCFGEMSLLCGDAASADVVATADSEALTLDRNAFNALVAAHPNLLREFIRMISRRLQATSVAVGVAREQGQNLTQFLRDEKAERYGELIGKSRELRRQIEAEAQHDRPLQIQGERSTGKELVARLVHFHSHRKDAPLLSTDCAQIAESPWGDKLFGDYALGGTGRAGAICYMTMAEGGTLVLKNVDALPPSIQERLAGFIESTLTDNSHDVRIVVTCRSSLADLAAAGKVSSNLAGLLSEQVIAVRPLRERKRDIPELAEHFMRKHAQRRNKDVTAIDEQAVRKLISYNYRIANVQELEECIERAVILTDDETIDAEEIMLGPPPAAHSGGLNLLGLPKPVVRAGLWLFPRAGQAVAGAVFAYILYQCFLPKGSHLATLLVWGIWWPVLALSFLFAGRVWCAICPMSLAGSAAQRFVNLKRRVPGWLKSNDIYIAVAGFYAIVWVEEVTGMRDTAHTTGVLLLFILSGALAASILFPRRTWCRHICPLGGVAGLCSTASLVELRPAVEVCIAVCTEHSCYKGNDHVAECPMFSHLMFQDSNQNCVLCMNCIHSCPNGSPRLNIRLPAQELWISPDDSPDTGRAIGQMLSLVAALLLIQGLESAHSGLAHLLRMHRALFVTGVLAISAMIPFLSLRPKGSRDGNADRPREVHFWQKVSAWGPLMASAFACYQIAFIPGIQRLRVGLDYSPAPGGTAGVISFSLLSGMRFGLLSLGLLVTAGVLWKLLRATGEKAWRVEYAISLIEGVVYWSAVLILMLRPTWFLG